MAVLAEMKSIGAEDCGNETNLSLLQGRLQCCLPDPHIPAVSGKPENFAELELLGYNLTRENGFLLHLLNLLCFTFWAGMLLHLPRTEVVSV